MIGWRARLATALAFLAAGYVQQVAFAGIDNSPAGLLAYHGSAALADLFMLMCASSILRGTIADDIERLCMASIVVNFFGWIAYLAYLSPVAYNAAILVIGGAQYMRLLYVGHNDAINLRRLMVRGRDTVGSQSHAQKAQR